jgi:hypothetical protein
MNTAIANASTMSQRWRRRLGAVASLIGLPDGVLDGAHYAQTILKAQQKKGPEVSLRAFRE